MAWHLQSGARGTAGQTLESWRDWEQQEDALLGLQAGWGVAAPPHPAQAASGVSAPWCSCLARHRTAAPSLPGPGGYLLHHAPLSIRSHLFLPNCCFIPPLLCFACRGTYIWSGCQGRGRKFIWENRRTWLFPNLQDTSTTGMQGARTGRTQRAQQAAWGVQPELRPGAQEELERVPCSAALNQQSSDLQRATYSNRHHQQYTSLLSNVFLTTLGKCILYITCWTFQTLREGLGLCPPEWGLGLGD